MVDVSESRGERAWSTAFKWNQAVHGYLAAIAVGLVVLVGCGPTSDRLQVNGQVQLDGVPLDKGTIRFTATDPGKTLSAGAMIRDGNYVVPQEKGLPPGEYRLQITSPDTSGKMVRYGAGPNNPGVMIAKDRIPPSYNVQSEQTVELTATGSNVFEFDIASEP